MKKRILSTLMALCLCLSLLPTAALATPTGTALTQDNINSNMTLISGEYYLGGDITLTSTLTVTGTVTLDLNGHNLTGAAGTDGEEQTAIDGGKGDKGGNAITVQSGGELTIIDTATVGSITGGNGGNGGKGTAIGIGGAGGNGGNAITVQSGGSLTVSAGRIIGGNGGNGGKGTAGAAGGKGGNGGDAITSEGGSLTVSGGEIIGGDGGDGGKSGGAGVGASGNGGDAIDTEGGSLTVSGGRIIGGNGGNGCDDGGDGGDGGAGGKGGNGGNAITVQSGGELTVSGGKVIGGNGGKGGKGTVIGTSGAGGNGGTAIDTEGGSLTVSGGEIVSGNSGASGSSNADNGDSGADGQAILSSGTGSINLECDVIIDSPLIVTGKTILDLNGHVLKYSNDNAKGSVIKIEGSGNLTLKDSDTTATHSGDYERLPLGGIITGGAGMMYKAKEEEIIYRGGGGVYNEGTFTMEGGTIANCGDYPEDLVGEIPSGGGVYNNGTFTMSGGSITDCAAILGGGVYNSGTFTMGGGSITSCTAILGGGLCNDKSFTISGTAIIENCTLIEGIGYECGAAVFQSSNNAVLYANGGTINGDVENDGTITRGNDATDYTTFDGEIENGKIEDVAKLTVTFNSNGGSDVDSQKVLKGQWATEPSNAPTKGDDIFGGWYEKDTDGAFKADKFDFSKAVTDNLTLYAKWTAIPSSGGGSSSEGSSGGGGSSSTPSITVPVSSASGSVNVKATVKNGNAKIEISDKQISQVIADGARNVTVDLSGLKNVTSTTLPSHVLDTMSAADGVVMIVLLPTGEITLDDAALDSLATGETVTISMTTISVTDLTTEQKDALGPLGQLAAAVDVSILTGTVSRSEFGGGKLTISIPYTPKSGEDTSKLTVWFITDDGRIENKGGYYDAEKTCFVFETEHLSQYLLVSVDTPVFTDVPDDAYYADAVTWAVLNGITTGMTETTFGPDVSCTRAQIVTFLWRAAGEPEPSGNSNPFTDVNESDYFYYAVLWAVENGITTGVTDTSFAPNATCTRAQAAAFLYRNEQASGGGFTGSWMFQLPFTDVPEWCYEAVAWCYMNGITQGTGETTFSPNGDCTRAQIVTMLYRLLGE